MQHWNQFTDWLMPWFGRARERRDVRFQSSRESAARILRKEDQHLMNGHSPGRW